MLEVLYGMAPELLGPESLLWRTHCYNCHERCPQQVRPVEVIIALKNMLADRGIYPTAIEKTIATLSEATHLLEDDALRERVNARLGRIGREYHGTTPVRHRDRRRRPCQAVGLVTPRRLGRHGWLRPPAPRPAPGDLP
jgi:hypothetical protein